MAHVREFAEEFSPLLLFAATSEWFPLTAGVGDDQSASVQHADELLQVLERDPLGRELGLEPLLDCLQRCFAIEHVEDGKLLLVESEIVESDGFLDDPVNTSMVFVAA